MERESFFRHLPKKEIFLRPVLAAALTASPVSLPAHPIEKTCGQKVYEYSINQPVAPESIGFTFSERAAEWHGLDPLESLEELLKMGFTTVRLATYMDQSTEEIIDELSSQIAIAKKYGVSVVLAVGGKAPHHPEWYPEWYRPREEENEEVRKAIEDDEIRKAHAVIERFGDDPTVKYWQLSNEALERSNGAERSRVLKAIRDKMREYPDKKIIVNHLIDLLSFDEDEFRRAAELGDIIGLNDFLQVGIFSDSCEEHIKRYQKYLQLVDEINAERNDEPHIELCITEAQTQRWLATIPREIQRFGITFPYDITIPAQFYDTFQPKDIPFLYRMQNMQLKPRVILEWEVLAALEQAKNGDPRALRELQKLLVMQQETKQRYSQKK